MTGLLILPMVQRGGQFNKSVLRGGQFKRSENFYVLTKKIFFFFKLAKNSSWVQQFQNGLEQAYATGGLE